LRFNHGDLKATNFLWVDGRLCILDLDAMELDLSAREVAARVARDRQRWRRNFMPGD
jgi:aminoglycoside phosphotransferase family enzyme